MCALSLTCVVLWLLWESTLYSCLESQAANAILAHHVRSGEK